jgi:hypothetical protein
MATDLQPSRAAPPSRYEAFVETQLRRARQRIRLLDLAVAGLVLLGLTLAYGLAVAFSDRALELSGTTRRIAFALYILAALGYLAAFLVRPLFRRINPYYAARRLEDSLPSAKNSVVSWLDLQDEAIPPAFRAAIARKAATDLAEADVDAAISARRAGWMSGVVLSLGVLLLVLFALGPRQFFSLLNRAFAPFVESSIATRTRLTLLRPEEGNLTVPVGRAVSFAVFVDGTVPDASSPQALRLLYRYSPGDPFEERLLSPGDSGREWITTVLAAEVHNGFWYKVTGGDAETAEYRVQVRSTPLLTGFDVTYHYRPYLGWQDRRTRDPNLRELRGTQATLIGHTNRPVRDGQLTREGEKPVVGTPVADDPHALQFRLTLERDGQYQVWFTSQDGEKNAEPMPYTIRVLFDQPPQVELGKPGQDIALPANGLLALEGLANDDFGVTALALQLKLENEQALAPKPYRPGKSFRLPEGGYPQALDYKDFVALDKLQTKGGGPLTLKPGQVLEYWLEATDNCDYPGPNKAESKHFRVTIAPPSADKTKQEEQNRQARQEQQQHEAQQDQKLQQQTGKPPPNPRQENNPQTAEKQPAPAQPPKTEEEKLKEQEEQLRKAIQEQEQQEKKQQQRQGDRSQQGSEQKRSGQGDAQKEQGKSEGQEGGEKKQQQSQGDRSQQGSEQKRSSEGDSQKEQGKSEGQEGGEKKEGAREQSGQGKESSRQGSDGSSQKNGPKGTRPDSAKRQEHSQEKGGRNEAGEHPDRGAKPGAERNQQPKGTGDKDQQKSQQSSQDPAKGKGDGNSAGSKSEGSNSGQPKSPEGQGRSDSGASEQANRPGEGKNGSGAGQQTKDQTSGGSPQDRQRGAGEQAAGERREGANPEQPRDGRKGSDGSDPKTQRPERRDGQAGSSAKSGERQNHAGSKAERPPGGGEKDRQKEGSATGSEKKDGRKGETSSDGDAEKQGRDAREKSSPGAANREPGGESSKTGQEQQRPGANAEQKSGETGDRQSGQGAKGDKGRDQNRQAGEKQESEASRAAEEKALKEKLESLSRDLKSDDPQKREQARRELEDLQRAAQEAQARRAAQKQEHGDLEKRGKESTTGPAIANQESNRNPKRTDRPDLSQGKPPQSKSGDRQESAGKGKQDKPGGDQAQDGSSGAGQGKDRRETDRADNRSGNPKGTPGSGAGGARGGSSPTARQPGPGDRAREGGAGSDAEESGTATADKEAARRAGSLQLDDIRKKVTKDVLKKANMTEEEYQRFLQAREALLKQQPPQPTEKEKLAAPSRGGTTGLPSQGVRRVEPGKTDGAVPLERLDAAPAPPEFRESYREFSRMLSEWKKPGDKK